MSTSAAPTRKTRISIEPIESYVKATQLDPQSAAAFLRSGILYGRRQQLPKANDAFSKAEDIYQAMSSQEGLAEVHYQTGIAAGQDQETA